MTYDFEIKYIGSRGCRPAIAAAVYGLVWARGNIEMDAENNTADRCFRGPYTTGYFTVVVRRVV